MNFYPKNKDELIAAISNASSGDTIYLQRGYTYALTQVNNTDSNGASGLPLITTTLTIVGNGATIKRDSTAASFRIFHVSPTGNLTLQGLTLSDGNLQGIVVPSGMHGAGIRNAGTLTLDHCLLKNHNNHIAAITGNPNGYGGAIYSASGATLIIRNSELSNNLAENGGGLDSDGTLSISNSIVANNRGQVGGGIIGGGNGTIKSCLVFGNSAQDGGGLRWLGDSSSTLTVTYTDIFQNSVGNLGGCIFVNRSPSNPTIILNYNRIFGNSGLTSVDNSTTAPQMNAQHNWWGANNGPSGVASGDGDSVSSNVDYSNYLSTDAAQHLGKSFCPICFGSNDDANSQNPISLRLGEKRLDVTDLSLNTPAESLAFTRSYRQNQQTTYQFMGLGWLHNHIYSLSLSGTSPTRIAQIGLPNGGTAVLNETVAGHFVASAGSTAVMDFKSATNEYLLVAQDRSQYSFDATTLRLKSRLWPNNESWTYTYYQPSDGADLDGKLKQVSDGYNRSLQFTYIRDTDPNAYQRRQLWRVGDQTAAGLDTGSPSGRYMELGYTSEKNNGVPVGTPKALLVSVKDVRGNTWTYDYYGQHSGETNANQLNWMTKRFSPSVDTTGDGTPDGVLTLEQLTYLFNYQLQVTVNGDMEADSDWTPIPGTSQATSERSNTQVFSGSYSRHVTAGGAGQGIEGKPWNLLLGRSYVISARVYPVSGSVTMRVRGIASLDQTTSGTGAWKSLSVNYTPTADQFNRTLQFFAVGGAAEFYVDSVSILETNTGMAGMTQERGIQGANPALLKTDFLVRPNGQEYTTETITAFGKAVTHRFERGIYAGAQDPAGNYAFQTPNDQFRSAFQTDARGNRTWLNWSADGKHLDQVADALGNASQFGYKTDDTLHNNVDAEGRKTLYAYENASIPRQPTLVVVTNGGDLAVNGGMEIDSNWASVGSPTTNIRSSTQVDTDSYARYLVASAAGQGIQGDPWNLVAGRAYLILARVYPVSGVVRMKVAGAPSGAFDKTTSGTGSWQTLRAVYKPTANATGVHLQFLADAGAATFYVDTVSIVDSTMLLRWQEFTFDSKGRTLTEKVIDPADGATVQQQVTRTYYTSGNGNGLLNTVTQKDVGGSNDVVSTYTYDSAGRVIKTQQSSNFGQCDISFTVYDAAGSVVATICNYDPGMGADPTNAAQAVALYNPSFPDKNRVTTYTYDTLGRRIGTTTNAGASFALTTLTVCDALDRVVRSISNYIADVGIPNPYTAAHNAFNHGTDNNQNLVTDTAFNARGMVKSQTDVLGNVTLMGYDDAGRLVKTIQSASQPSYNNDYSGTSPDPSLAAYTTNGNADQDIVTTQTYDAAGNLVKTVDSLGNVAFTVYDSLNRPVKIVRAAKDDATLTYNPGDVGYNAANDPRSESYAPSTSPDRDLIETTEYDAMGRVIRTKRLLDNRPSAQWDTTLFGYDTLGRQVRVIGSASQPDYNVTADPSLASYIISPSADQDIVKKTVYDAKGRVMYTEDPFGARTWVAYDGLGRQVKTITNAVGTATDGSANDPRSNSYAPSSAADKDLITITTYDSSGRVQSTQDALNRVTRNVYDTLGRVIRIITNYVAQGTTDPKDWVWSSTNNRWEYGVGNTTAISHGTDNDQNIIADTVYDTHGWVSQTFDNRHNTTLYLYDVLGRQVKTVVNYVVQGSSNPANWLWSTTNSRWEDGSGNTISFGADKDQNRITATIYDLAGRVSSSRDAAGIETRYTYDALGHRTQTTINYVDGVFNPSFPDEDLISTTTYNKGGQVVTATDARGTQTAVVYDKAGRRLNVTQAASSPLASVFYTAYDKGGGVLRSIQNWTNDPAKPSPDAKDSLGNWLFVPAHNGSYNDRDLVMNYLLDRVGRQVQTLDPLGNESLTGYDKDGQVKWMIDPEYTITHYRYDGVRRRNRVVQGYQAISPAAKIVFRTNRDGNYEIYSMNPDGTSQINLTNYPSSDDTFATWSHDGSKVAFISARSGVQDLYVMNADGTGVQRLPTVLNTASGQLWYPDAPAWSPDGGQIAFTVQKLDIARYVIAVVNADGSNLRLVYADLSLNASGPAWSPDGQRLAFHAGSNLNVDSDIYTIHLDGTQPINLTRSAARLNQYPAWSPDDSKLTFLSKRDGDREVYVMNADGTNLVNLTQYSGADDSLPAWSPDGTQIVFHSNRDGDSEIFRMNADGTIVTQLTSNTASDAVARWSPKVTDPATWVWSTTNSRWEDGSGNALPHGPNNDRNIIVDVTYDKAGRILSQRDPRGNLTSYVYDKLNRRKSLTNPISKVWSTTFSDLTTGGRRTTMTYPGITGSANYTVQRDFDRLGRPLSIAYGDPTVTRDVKFTYDDAGNRAKMSEYNGAGFTSRIRETTLNYDDTHRLLSVGFDSNGDGTVDDTVSYEYDVGGLRTKLTLPGSLNVIYTYDKKGQLISLTDWDSQPTQFAYDLAGRHIATERANGVRSRYEYDAAGRLKRLRHTKDFQTFGHFEYQVDKRGNRTQALAGVANAPTTTDTIIAYNDKGLALGSIWSEVGGFKESSQFNASLKLIFLGDEATLTMGTGPDHSIYDVYVGGSLWQSFDGYAATASQRDIVISIGVDSRKLQGEGPHLVEIRNRAEKNKNSNGYKVRFKQLLVVDRTWVMQTIKYTYDNLARLLEARYAPGINAVAADADLMQRYLYSYDRAGNRLSQSVALNGGSPTVTNYSYNPANQITTTGFTYDNNGNLTNDGTYSYAWDRANRLLGTTHAFMWLGQPVEEHNVYSYDGLGRRWFKRETYVPQTFVTSRTSSYLLDIQPELEQVLVESVVVVEGSNETHRYIHAPRGIHAHENTSGAWDWIMQDGLGSVAGTVTNTASMLGGQLYPPYGGQGSASVYGFTGEAQNSNRLLYLRARYYNPALGQFVSLDPMETPNRYAYVGANPINDAVGELLSLLNGYSYANGNPVNLTDPSGMAAIDIWAAAFIQPYEIDLFYAGDLHAHWRGDNRAWYSGGPVPVSSRVWFSVHFDPSNRSTVVSDARTGFTHVSWVGFDRQPYSVTNKAPDPNPATVGYTGVFGDIIVEMDAGMSGANPMNFALPTPPIELRYTIYFRISALGQLTSIDVWREIDRFPWHELYISIDGIPIVQLHQEPPGPILNPFDLFLPAYRDIVIFPTSNSIVQVEKCAELPFVI